MSDFQQVLVKVDSQEFKVEIEDLSTSPIIAIVEGQRYEVELGGQTVESQVVQTVRNVPLPKSDSVTSPKTSQSEAVSAEGSVTAPMPGDITEVNVQPGQRVEGGDALCVLDAMKMKNVIHSPRPGLIASVEINEGQTVDYGAVLVTYK